MANVDADDGNLQVDSQHKSVGMVWWSVATQSWVCIHRMNGTNFRNSCGHGDSMHRDIHNGIIAHYFSGAGRAVGPPCVCVCACVCESEQ